MKSFFLFVLAAMVVAELSEDCQYVNATFYLTDPQRVKNCFESYTMHPAVLEAIMRNLEVIEQLYPYSDIAMNPPNDPPGYFKTINMTAEIENLRTVFAESNGVVSKVFRPLMKLINGFHDDHLNVNLIPANDSQYDTLFSSVAGFLPFWWDAVVDGDKRHITIRNPNSRFLSNETCDLIDDFFEKGYYVASVDGGDPFEFFSKLFGEYNTGKSPQGALVHAKTLVRDWFLLLQYPLENIFDRHTLVFNDPDSTSVEFNMSFANARGVNGEPNSIKKIRSLFNDPPSLVSMEKEKEIRNEIKNFKRRSVRQTHRILPCDTFLNIGANMNYISIPTFSADERLFLQELVECVALFDTNPYPITIILPNNGGGSLDLMELTQFLLLPSSDFRIARAMRKSERGREIGVEKEYLRGVGTAGNNETCDTLESKSAAEAFWEKTFVDDLGNGITHKRTGKGLKDDKDLEQMLLPYRMTKNVRKPTDIIVATDGFCFSACAFFVYNVIRAGAGIVTGFGATNPGDELFAAAQCPSSVTNLDKYFDDLSNNSVYGLATRSTTTESFEITPNMNESIPGDYTILRIDVHSGYYDDYDKRNFAHVLNLLRKTAIVRDQFTTKCNSNNKRLRFISDEPCKTNKPYAVMGGYACGSNGEWDDSVCKVAKCQEGYVVDFENDKCIPNPCDIRYDPASSHSESFSSAPPRSSSVNSSSFICPMMAFILILIISIINVVH